MNQMIRNWYKTLDIDQQSIIKATVSCFLLTCFISCFTQTTDLLFFIFVASSFACSHFFARSNSTTFSQKKLISKNGKIFSLKDRRKYWVFLLLMAPLSFFVTGPLIKILGFNLNISYGMLRMAIFQVLSSRLYLFHKKIPLSAFALGSEDYRSTHGFAPSSSSFNNIHTNSFKDNILSPIPNSANGWGSIGPSSSWK